MSIDRLIPWITAIILAFAAAGRLDILQLWIWRAQARAVHEARTSTWGSPHFWRSSNNPDEAVKPESHFNRNNANAGENHSNH